MFFFIFLCYYGKSFFYLTPKLAFSMSLTTYRSNNGFMKKSIKHDKMITSNDESSTSPAYKNKKNSNSCNVKSSYTIQG